MKIVIFAGGTGKRFWPVSRINNPKQFSPLISGKPLLRLRIEALMKGFKPEDIFISTGKKYESEVMEIAPELPVENLILEPEMRDTGPAVTLAVAYIQQKYPDELVCIQWSDHLIKDETTFIASLKEGEKLIQDKTKAVFITVPARFPSPHRGYIKFGNEVSKISSNITVYDFDSFKEKPDVETAKEYIKSESYGWNPGYWIIEPNFYMSKVQAMKPEIYQVCTNIAMKGLESEAANDFSELEKIAADYIFAERVNSEEAKVLWTDMGWSDVGEWIALKEALQTDDESIVTKGKVKDLDSKDSIIYNLEDSKLISTIGLEGMVVVNTKDVIAIFSKDDNNRLKEYLADLDEKWL